MYWIHSICIFRICDVINVVGLFGNTMVILCVIKAPKMKSITIKFIGNLAVFDLLFNLNYILASILFFSIRSSKLSMAFLDIVSPIMSGALATSSTYTLIVIFYYRFKSSSRPFTSSKKIKCFAFWEETHVDWCGFTGECVFFHKTTTFIVVMGFITNVIFTLLTYKTNKHGEVLKKQYSFTKK